MDKKVLHSVLDQQAALQQDKIAIKDPEGVITYGKLKNYSNAVAQCLKEQGCQRQEVVAVYMPASIAYVAGILGISKAGGIFMPLEMKFPVKRMQDLLDYVKPRVILTHEASINDLWDKLEGEQQKYIEKVIQISPAEEGINALVFDSAGKKLSDNFYHGGQEIPLTVDGEDGVYLLYTSGSTGTPKVIEGCHKSLSHFIHWEVKEFALDESTFVSQLAPLSFDVSLRDLFVPLLCGGTLCIPSAEIKSQPLQLIQWIRESGISLMHMVPSVFRLLTRELKDNPRLLQDLKSLKYILLAGEALYGRDVLSWRSVMGTQVELVNLYGPTETTLAKVYNRIGEVPKPEMVMPLGKPISNTVIIIIKNKKLCEVDEIGEIYIKTPFRSKGYYKNEALTKEKFIQNPLHNDYEDILYRTGDLGKYLEDRSIAFIGRQDGQVKIRGNRVELQEVEGVLGNFPGVSQAVVLAIRAQGGEDVLACYYTAPAELDPQELRTFLANYLPVYMHPSYFVYMQELPLNLNGKVDKKALPAPEELLYARMAYEAPCNEAEHKLAAIWAEVLGLKKAGVNNTFFELGGHSLTATKAVSRIYKEMGKEVSLKDFFDHPTIRGLAQFMAEKDVQVYDTITPLDIQEHYALSRAQRRLWILDQQQSQMVAYNIPYACILKGSISVEALRKSFETVIERHESLRTTFLSVAGEPRQKIHSAVSFHLEERDHSEKPQQEVINHYLKKELTTPFDLAAGPLLRASLVKLSGDQHLLLFTIHHIVSDAWSLGILMQEVVTLYEAYNQGKENPLSPLRIHYKDYAAWQNAALQQGKFEAHRLYWHKQLSDELPSLHLPFDFARKDSKSYEGDKYTFRLSVEMSETIRRICREEAASLFMFLLSVIKLFLYKYNPEGDIITGTSLAGRNHMDLEGQIGFYIQSLALRSRIRKGDRFREYLSNVRQVTLHAYAHPDYPVDLLAEELDVKRTDHKNPFYDVLVVLFNAGLSGDNTTSRRSGALPEIETFEIETGTSKLDLTFFIHDEPDIGIMLEYNSALFMAEKIQKVGGQIQTIIETVIKDMSIPIEHVVSKLADIGEKELLEDNLKSISENF